MATHGSANFSARLARILGHQPERQEMAETSGPPMNLPAVLAVAQEPQPAFPNVSTEVSDILQHRVACPPLWPAPLQPHFEHILDEVQGLEEPQGSQHLQKLCNFYCQHEKPLLQASKEAVSRVSSVPADRIESHLSTLVTTLLQVDKNDRAMLEKIVVESGARLIGYVHGALQV